MDYSKLTIDDVTKNPQLLDELKGLAASGTQLRRIEEQRKGEFISSKFHTQHDAEKALNQIRVKPVLKDDMTLGFTDPSGRFILQESVLAAIEAQGMYHYLKPQSAAHTAADRPPSPPIVVDNPWVTGNATKQRLMANQDPQRAAQLKQAAQNSR
jgi:hypothetical protein